MPPIRTAVALPPRAAGRIGAHPVTHPELEDPGEGAGGRQADRQGLENAERRVSLHQPNQPHDRFAGHQAVGVQDDHVLEPVAPGGTEILDIADLLARVVGAAAIVKTVRPVGDRLPRGEAAFLLGGDFGFGRVRQKEDFKRRLLAGARQRGLDNP